MIKLDVKQSTAEVAFKTLGTRSGLVCLSESSIIDSAECKWSQLPYKLQQSEDPDGA